MQLQDHLIPTNRVSSPQPKFKLELVGQAAEFEFESKFKPLPIIWQSMPITPKGYSRRQSKVLTAKSMLSSWGSTPAQLGLVELASTNTRHFLVGCSCYWPQSAHLSATLWPLLLNWLSSRVKMVLMLCKFMPTANHFSFKWNAICNGICKKLWPTKINHNQSSSHCFTQFFYHCLVSE